MTTDSRRSHLLLEYLLEHGFAPVAEGAWLDRDTGQQTIRVRHEPGETTLLYCLAPRGGCLYEAVFSPGTPGAVITAAIEAAIRPSGPGPAGAPREGTGDPR